MNRTICWTLGIVIFALGLTASGEPAQWPQWRGPGGQGHAQTAGLPLTWSETQHITWRAKLPGKGHSSPVIAGDQIWLTYAVEYPASPEEAARRLKANTGSQPLTVLAKVDLHAICISRQTGQVLHDVKLISQPAPQWVHRLNSYASPTPIIHQGRLYCHFGAYGTACLDAGAAKVLWVNQDHVIMHENGPGSTPILHGGLLIFHCDGSDKQYVAALDAKTGKTAWTTPRTGKMNANPQLKKAYATPLIVPINGKPQMISPGADWLYAYDPATGKELWKLEYGVLGFSNVPRPVAGHGMVYICTSFMRSQLLAVRIDGQGRPKQPHIAWRYKRGAPQMPSPLLVGDEIYFVTDQAGILTCLDARTGQEHYRERIDGAFSSSPIYADGRIYLCSRSGVTHVIKPGKTFKMLAQNKLDGEIMASPAAVEGALFIRTDKALYRIESLKTAAR